MAFKRGGEIYNPSEDVRQATAGGAITNRALVILSAEDTITHNTVAGDVRAVGIALDGYASGDKGCDYAYRGRLEFIAGGAIAVNDPLTPDSTAGRVRKAVVGSGERIIGRALKSASTAGDLCLGEFDFSVQASREDVIVYHNAAITANTNVTLPNVAGTYLIEGLYIAETAAQNVTGGITVGTSAGGTQFFSAITVNASTAYYKLPADATALAITLSAGSALSIQSSNWNSASVIFNLRLRRLY